MNIKIVDRIQLQDGTSRFNISVDDKERIYLGYILESFEGWCNYTTPAKSQPILQVDVAPDFVRNFHKLYEFLVDWKIV
ncbi:hypothetical protein ACFLYJ_01630 [Candidatus Cloacimonadota bacterium]